MSKSIITPFPFKPANKISIARRSLIFGVGRNDADYVVRPTMNGKEVKCPYHRVWGSMLKRCYSAKYQEKYPTYIGCSVCDEWLIFSNFKKWMEGQAWEGMNLDKDILVPGNKTYAPEYCRFVSAAINSLLGDCGRARGNLLIGVSIDKKSDRFLAQCRGPWKNSYLGCYNTQNEAHTAWRAAKAEAIRLTVDAESPLPEIREALIARAVQLENSN